MTVYEVIKKMKSGATLTVQKRRIAHIDKYRPDEIEVDINVANTVISMGTISCWGGNLDTGDRHYQLKEPQ